MVNLLSETLIDSTRLVESIIVELRRDNFTLDSIELLEEYVTQLREFLATEPTLIPPTRIDLIQLEKLVHEAIAIAQAELASTQQAWDAESAQQRLRRTYGRSPYPPG